MATYHDLTEATKTEPHGWGIDWTPASGDGPAAGVLTIKGKRNYCAYVVVEFSPGWDGRAFTLSKLDEGTDKTEEQYSCFLARNGQERQCECKGFHYAGHCRHLHALKVLLTNGWI